MGADSGQAGDDIELRQPGKLAAVDARARLSIRRCVRATTELSRAMRTRAYLPDPSASAAWRMNARAGAPK